jgi:tetratricopeptide (TPR) repeat protein
LRHDIADLLAEFQEQADAAKADRDLLANLADVRTSREDEFDEDDCDRRYLQAFGRWQLDPDREPDVLVQRVRNRPEPVRLEIAAALDDWAVARLSRLASKVDNWRALLALASQIDPDPERKAMRALIGQNVSPAQREQLRLWATPTGVARPAASVLLLARALQASGQPRDAEAVLREGQRKHPGDPWINYDLGTLLFYERRYDEAVRFFSAARALRPEVGHQLAHALAYRGDFPEAEALFRELCLLRTENYRHRNCLGVLLRQQSKYAASVQEFTEAIRCKREDAFAAFAYQQRGTTFLDWNKLAEAEADFRRALGMQSRLVIARNNLGVILDRQGNTAGWGSKSKPLRRLEAPFGRHPG